MPRKSKKWENWWIDQVSLNVALGTEKPLTRANFRCVTTRHSIYWVRLKITINVSRFETVEQWTLNLLFKSWKPENFGCDMMEVFNFDRSLSQFRDFLFTFCSCMRKFWNTTFESLWTLGWNIHFDNKYWMFF